MNDCFFVRMSSFAWDTGIGETNWHALLRPETGSRVQTESQSTAHVRPPSPLEAEASDLRRASLRNEQNTTATSAPMPDVHSGAAGALLSRISSIARGEDSVSSIAARILSGASLEVKPATNKIAPAHINVVAHTSKADAQPAGAHWSSAAPQAWSARGPTADLSSRSRWQTTAGRAGPGQVAVFTSSNDNFDDEIEADMASIRALLDRAQRDTVAEAGQAIVRIRQASSQALSAASGTWAPTATAAAGSSAGSMRAGDDAGGASRQLSASAAAPPPPFFRGSSAASFAALPPPPPPHHASAPAGSSVAQSVISSISSAGHGAASGGSTSDALHAASMVGGALSALAAAIAPRPPPAAPGTLGAPSSSSSVLARGAALAGNAGAALGGSAPNGVGASGNEDEAMVRTAAVVEAEAAAIRSRALAGLKSKLAHGAGNVGAGGGKPPVHSGTSAGTASASASPAASKSNDSETAASSAIHREIFKAPLIDESKLKTRSALQEPGPGIGADDGGTHGAASSAAVASGTGAKPKSAMARAFQLAARDRDLQEQLLARYADDGDDDAEGALRDRGREHERSGGKGRRGASQSASGKRDKGSRQLQNQQQIELPQDQQYVDTSFGPPEYVTMASATRHGGRANVFGGTGVDDDDDGGDISGWQEGEYGDAPRLPTNQSSFSVAAFASTTSSRIPRRPPPSVADSKHPPTGTSDARKVKKESSVSNSPAVAVATKAGTSTYKPVPASKAKALASTMSSATAAAGKTPAASNSASKPPSKAAVSKAIPEAPAHAAPTATRQVKPPMVPVQKRTAAASAAPGTVVPTVAAPAAAAEPLRSSIQSASSASMAPVVPSITASKPQSAFDLSGDASFHMESLSAPLQPQPSTVSSRPGTAAASSSAAAPGIKSHNGGGFHQTAGGRSSTTTGKGTAAAAAAVPSRFGGARAGRAPSQGPTSSNPRPATAAASSKPTRAGAGASGSFGPDLAITAVPLGKQGQKAVSPVGIPATAAPASRSPVTSATAFGTAKSPQGKTAESRGRQPTASSAPSSSSPSQLKATVVAVPSGHDNAEGRILAKRALAPPAFEVDPNDDFSDLVAEVQQQHPPHQQHHQQRDRTRRLSRSRSRSASVVSDLQVDGAGGAGSNVVDRGHDNIIPAAASQKLHVHHHLRDAPPLPFDRNHLQVAQIAGTSSSTAAAPLETGDARPPIITNDEGLNASLIAVDAAVGAAAAAVEEALSLSAISSGSAGTANGVGSGGGVLSSSAAGSASKAAFRSGGTGVNGAGDGSRPSSSRSAGLEFAASTRAGPQPALTPHNPSSTTVTGRLGSPDHAKNGSRGLGTGPPSFALSPSSPSQSNASIDNAQSYTSRPHRNDNLGYAFAGGLESVGAATFERVLTFDSRPSTAATTAGSDGRTGRLASGTSVAATAVVSPAKIERARSQVAQSDSTLSLSGSHDDRHRSQVRADELAPSPTKSLGSGLLSSSAMEITDIQGLQGMQYSIIGGSATYNVNSSSGSRSSRYPGGGDADASRGSAVAAFISRVTSPSTSPLKPSTSAFTSSPSPLGSGQGRNGTTSSRSRVESPLLKELHSLREESHERYSSADLNINNGGDGDSVGARSRTVAALQFHSAIE